MPLKIVALSDTHNHGYALEKLPKADVLVHAGDACIYGTDDELANFAHWLNNATHKYEHVLYVPGNHDKSFNGPGYDEIARSIVSAIAPKAHILINQEYQIGDFLIYGSPMTVPIGRPWYYYATPDKMEEFWGKLAVAEPDGYHLLITHDPPNRVGDKVNNNWHHWPYVGCKALRQYVEDTQPLAHVFGHIHEGYGVYEGRHTSLRTRENTAVDTVFVNAAIRDENYKIKNSPWILHFDKLFTEKGIEEWQLIGVDRTTDYEAI